MAHFPPGPYPDVTPDRFPTICFIDSSSLRIWLITSAAPLAGRTRSIARWVRSNLGSDKSYSSLGKYLCAKRQTRDIYLPSHASEWEVSERKFSRYMLLFHQVQSETQFWSQSCQMHCEHHAALVGHFCSHLRTVHQSECCSKTFTVAAVPLVFLKERREQYAPLPGWHNSTGILVAASVSLHQRHVDQLPLLEGKLSHLDGNAWF